MEVKKNNGPWYRVMSKEAGKEATIMLYDYIGEYWDLDENGNLCTAGLKDIEFVQELERLAELYPVIHLRINSPGGEVFHGSAIVNAIRKCKAEVHTWNDGVAASMAALIWAAGKERHMAKNAMLMFHSGLWVCIGNPKDMRNAADTLDKMNEAMISGMAESTGIPEEELHRRYFADYADHWLTFRDAEKDGLINAMSEYENPVKTADPEALAGMNHRQLIAWFEKTQHPDSPGFMERVRAAYEKTIAAVTGQPAEARSAKEGNTQPSSHSQTDINDMNFEDFKKSVGDGSLSLEQVKAHLESLTPPAPAAPAEPTAASATPATPVATVPDEPVAATAISALEAANADLKAQIEALKATVAEFGKQPGAGKSTPGMPSDDLPDAGGANSPAAFYARMNAELAAAAARNEPANFLIAEN